MNKLYNITHWTLFTFLYLNSVPYLVLTVACAIVIYMLLNLKYIAVVYCHNSLAYCAQTMCAVFAKKIYNRLIFAACNTLNLILCVCARLLQIYIYYTRDAHKYALFMEHINIEYYITCLMLRYIPRWYIVRVKFGDAASPMCRRVGAIGKYIL